MMLTGFFFLHKKERKYISKYVQGTIWIIKVFFCEENFLQFHYDMVFVKLGAKDSIEKKAKQHFLPKTNSMVLKNQ